MSAPILDVESLRRSLNVRDLTDPNEGAHALQLLVREVHDALAARGGAPVLLVRRSPIVSVADNYDRLGYAPHAIARDARYSRYVCETALLRTHTTAMIPGVLRQLPTHSEKELAVLCPGIVYRRDSIDRRHTGEPHQMDVWILRRGERLCSADLDELVTQVLGVLLPGRERRMTPATHPYTEAGRQIDVRDDGGWMEVAECGLASSELLHANGLGSWSGLALGVGLDRVLMLRKGIPDIRLLRATDPRVAAQMNDLSAYRPVSVMPAVRRDLSLVLDAEDDPEIIGDRVRTALGSDSEVLESLEVLSETAHRDLPQSARERLGIRESQRNVLLRLVLRAYDRTLTRGECNLLRDRVYLALPRGARYEWASGDPSSKDGP